MEYLNYFKLLNRGARSQASSRKIILHPKTVSFSSKITLIYLLYFDLSIFLYIYIIYKTKLTINIYFISINMWSFVIIMILQDFAFIFATLYP